MSERKDRPVKRRDFIRAASKAALPTIAFLGFGIGGKLAAGPSRGGGDRFQGTAGEPPDRCRDCASTCEIACSNTCSLSCKEACRGVCKDDCSTSCKDLCRLSCGGTCKGGCEGGCGKACEGVCRAQCADTCAKSAWS